MERILAQQNIEGSPSLNHPRQQFFLLSIALAVQLRELDYKKAQYSKKANKIVSYPHASGWIKKWSADPEKKRKADEEIHQMQAKLEEMELLEEISTLASDMAGEAFRNPEITVDLMADLAAWSAFIYDRKQSRRYGLKTFVGMELGVFLRCNGRFPKRSELRKALNSAGTKIAKSQMSECLEYYDANAVVLDYQKG